MGISLNKPAFTVLNIHLNRAVNGTHTTDTENGFFWHGKSLSVRK
jgi:hypothetical protein